MNNAYKSVWNARTGTWHAAAETAKSRGRAGAKVIAACSAAACAAALCASPGAHAAPNAPPKAGQATTGQGGLELCRGSSTEGHAWGWTGNSELLDCVTPLGLVSFSLNSAATDSGGWGIDQAPARVTGYTNGTLELQGKSGISMLNGVRMNGNAITELKAGDVSQTSTDAVNGSQLYAAQQSITALSKGRAGLVQQAGPGENLKVGAQADGVAVEFTNRSGALRELTGVAPGVLSRTSTEAVNGAQLYDTNRSIASLEQTVDTMSFGGTGLVRPDERGETIKVGAGASGGAVDLTNKDGENRTLTGVAPGDVSSTSREAVNGSQLNAASERIDRHDADIAGLGERATRNETGIAALDERAARNETGMADLGERATRNATGIAALDERAARNETGMADLGERATRNETGIAALDERAARNETGMVDLGERATRNETGIAALDERAARNETGMADLGERATRNETSIADLNAGRAGLVQQAGAGQNLTVGARTDGAAVDFTNRAGESRTLAGVAPGTLSNTSTEAVNGAQLFQTNQRVQGNASAIDGLDDRLGSSETRIASIDQTLSGLSSGSVGLVSQDGGDTVRIGAASGGGTVDLSNQNGAERKLTGLAAGEVSGSSQDAVNGAQLYETNQQITHIDARTTRNETSIANLNAGRAGLVQQAGRGENLTVGAQVDGVAVEFRNRSGALRELTGVAPGVLSSTSTEAVNGAQLYDTNRSISSLEQTVDSLSFGGTGLVRPDERGETIRIGGAASGSAVDLTNQDGESRTLTGVAPGDVSSGSQQAVNGNQLNTTNERVERNQADIAGLGDRTARNEAGLAESDARTTRNETGIAALDERTTRNETGMADLGERAARNETGIANLNAGRAGLVQQAGPGENLTVGAQTDGLAVDFRTHAGGSRTLTGIGAGTLSNTSTDAVNGAQLFQTNQSVQSNASALDGLDSRIHSSESHIADIDQALNGLSSGGAGLVRQDDGGETVRIGAASGGGAVDFTNQDGAERKLTGVGAGEVSGASQEAVNGGQLYATNQEVAHNSERIGNHAAAIGGLDTRVTHNETHLSSLDETVSGLSNGTAGLIQQGGTGAALTIGAGSGGNAVDFSGADGRRRLTGVANGVDDSDAATVGQINALGTTLGQQLQGAVRYDDSTLAHVSLGGANGTVIANLADGAVAAGSRDAVNGGQLFTLQQQFGDLAGRVTRVEAAGTSGSGGGESIDAAGAQPGSTQVGTGSNATGGGSTALGQGSNASGDGSTALGQGTDASGAGSTALGQDSNAAGSGATALGQGSAAEGSNSTALGQGSNVTGNSGTALGQGSAATGSNATALGQGAVATGENSMAVGQGASAGGANAVALGNGSVASRDNSVSVGVPGGERQITNVAPGVAGTDAVNLQQMNNKSDSIRRDAFSGVATAMAVAGLPQSVVPGRTMVALGGATYSGQFGSALGVSYMTRDGSWIVKASASAGDRGAFGASVAAGYYW